MERPIGIEPTPEPWQDRKSTRLNSSHLVISYAVFCLKKKKNESDNIGLMLLVHKSILDDYKVKYIDVASIEVLTLVDTAKDELVGSAPVMRRMLNAVN